MRNAADRETVAALWDYSCLNPKRELPKAADLILAFGSSDLGVAKTAASAYKKLGGGILAVSGDNGEYVKGAYTNTDAERFAKIATRLGVSEGDIVLDTRARTIEESIWNTYQLIERVGRIAARSVVLVHAPFMERRIKAAWDATWPQAAATEVTTFSENLQFLQYCSLKKRDPEEVISQMLETIHSLLGAAHLPGHSVH